MIANIFVIGSGNIGSRHVQSLASLSSKLNIFVIDPNKENLDKTKKLFFDQKLNFFQAVTDQPVKFLQILCIGTLAFYVDAVFDAGMVNSCQMGNDAK